MSKGRSSFQINIDDTLTENFNNVESIRCFILVKIARLTEFIEERYGDDVRVFIKGGSSLKIMRKVNEDIEPVDWSDFDNQIIINPNLPIEKWYKIMSEIHCYMKEEYLPIYQQDWEAFLTCNRKEFDVNKQNGLNLFKGDLIENNILDFPTIKFNKGEGKSKTEHTLKLTLAKKSQSNMVFNTGMGLLHPQNHFDNAMIIPDIDNSILSVIEQQGLNEDEIFYNSFYPAAPSALDETLIATENPYSSSILINTSISKFLLYRVIVRYKTYDYYKDGEPKLKLGKENAFGPEQKMFESNNIAKFRGELIDISIPRRESYEALQQWEQVKTMSLLYTPGRGRDTIWVNVPDWKYQLNENVLLILEVFDHISGSPHKFYKRVMRGCTAVEAIFESYKARYAKSGLASLKNNIKSKSFQAAFDLLNKKSQIGFLIPLLNDVYKIIQNDYGWKKISDSSTKFEIPDAFDIEKIIGKDIEVTLHGLWVNLKDTNPDKSTNKSYDDILVKKVMEDDDGNVTKITNENYEKSKMMLAFMKLYEEVHHKFKKNITISNKGIKEGYDLSTLNQLRMDIENLVCVDSCTFGGLLSSMIHMYNLSGKRNFDFHYPFVELFVFSSDIYVEKKLINSIDKIIFDKVKSNKSDSFVKLDEKKNIESIQVMYPGFSLPIIINIIKDDMSNSEEKYNKHKEFEHLQTKKIRRSRVRISGMRKQMAHNLNDFNDLSDLKDSSDLKDKGDLLNEIDSNKKVHDSLNKALYNESEIMKTLMEESKENNNQKQNLLIFNNLSTVQFMAEDGVYRVLLASEAIKHMDLKISHTESFYQMHWLDHHRCEFKDMITTFPSKRIDVATPGVEIYSSLNTYQSTTAFSSAAKGDFSKPIKHANTTANKAVTDISTMNSWTNVGGDITPLLMSQMLGIPIEVISAASSDDIQNNRLSQVNLFNQRLDEHFNLDVMVPIPLSVGIQTMTLRPLGINRLIVYKIGNHYWVPRPGQVPLSMPSDGDCFYHAILHYFNANPLFNVQFLRQALSDFANTQRLTEYDGSNRLQYLINNIGAIENSFRLAAGYFVNLNEVVGGMEAIHRGLIRTLRNRMIHVGGAVDLDVDDDLHSIAVILKDIQSVVVWTPHRARLITLARTFMGTRIRPNIGELPTEVQLAIN